MRKKFFLVSEQIEWNLKFKEMNLHMGMAQVRMSNHPGLSSEVPHASLLKLHHKPSQCRSLGIVTSDQSVNKYPAQTLQICKEGMICSPPLCWEQDTPHGRNFVVRRQRQVEVEPLPLLQMQEFY